MKEIKTILTSEGIHRTYTHKTKKIAWISRKRDDAVRVYC